MSLIFYAGIAIATLGLLGILRFIQRVRRIKDVKENDAAVQAELRALVVLNMASVGLAFFGLAIAIVGLILG